MVPKEVRPFSDKRLGRRVVSRQLISALLDSSASIRTKAKTAGSEPLATQACIVPRCTQMSPAAAVVEFEVTFALEADRVVEGLGAVHELRPARCELDHPTHAALARADVIVADDKTLALQLGGRIRVVDRHLVGRPDVDARDAGPTR